VGKLPGVYQRCRSVLFACRGFTADAGSLGAQPAACVAAVPGLPWPGRTVNGGYFMEADVMFLDCPAYMDKHGAARCGLPSEVEYWYTARSTEGPLENAKIRCPRGHWFNGTIESLTWNKHRSATSPSTTVRVCDLPI
jgi:hypothetical protein